MSRIYQTFNSARIQLLQLWETKSLVISVGGRRLRLCSLLLLLFLWCMVPDGFSRQQAPAIRRMHRILVLNSYHKGLEWTDAQTRGILQAAKDSKFPIEVSFEYLDLKRINDETHYNNLQRLLQHKLIKQQYDVLVTTDDAALHFALKHSKDLFKNIPIVFGGLAKWEPEFRKKNTDTTGVMERIAARETMNLALRLHPEAKQIIVICDRTLTGLKRRGEFEKALKELDRPVKGEIVDNVTMEELLERLRSLPNDAIVFFHTYNRDSAGKTFGNVEATRLICEAAERPVYSARKPHFGHGVIGGYLTDGETHGREVMSVVEQVLAGRPARDIPITRESETPLMLDYAEMTRAGISEDDLPDEATVINKPFSFYETYKTLVWVVSSSFVLLLILVCFLSWNIMQRHIVERNLRDSEGRYRAVYSTAPLAFVLWDTDCRVVDWNDQAESTFGWSRNEVVGKRFFDFLIPLEARPTVHEIVDALLAGQLQNDAENQNLTKDGGLIWCRWNNAIQTDKEGQIVGVLSLALDITDRKRTEEDLRKAKSYISNIINSMPSILVGVDPQGRVTQWNAEAVRQTGVAVTDAIGYPLDHWLPHLKSEMPKITEAVKERRQQMNIRRKREQDGTCCYEDVAIYPLVANDVEGTVVRIDDVTERVQLEEMMVQSEKMRAVGLLAGGVAHDFNNMLAGIIGSAELLQAHLDSSKQALRLHGMIVKSAERAAELARNLLTFSRKQAVVSNVIDLHAVIGDVIMILKSTIDRRVEIVNACEAERSNVEGDSVHLQSVFLNLGINASHAMVEGGCLTYRTQLVELDNEACEISAFELAPGTYIEAIVEDTGCGIPAENIGKVFEPFFTTKEQGEGTGLGLAAVYGTIQQHQGSIRVESTLGGGTRFHILLPIAEVAVEHCTENTDLQLGKGTVLVADDEMVIRATLGEALTKLGYKVIIAENGEEAVSAYRNRGDSIDLVILDMVMPVMNGCDAFRAIRKIDPQARCIIASGFSSDVNINELLQEGLKGFVEKPFRTSELSRVVADALVKTSDS